MMIRPCILLGVLSRITTAQYITPSTASEVVLLPDPTTPIIPTVRTNCPHLQTGLSDWHESSTWGGGSIPTSGSVTIPTATRVLLSQTLSGPVGVLTIPADSELIVGEGVAMDLEGMDVQGKLTIGSETCLVEDQVTLTLHGSRPTDIDTNPKPEHFKGISVNGGTLNLHGKRYFPTWSRLAATVHFNENVLVLQQTVNWVSGQQIVLVTSSIKDSRDYHQNEVAIIDQVISLSGAGSMIHLVDPVQYTHLANSNYQVEVGLLSRSILIQGADDSEPSDPDPLTCIDDRADVNWNIYLDTTKPCPDKELTGFGGHIIIHNNGVGQVEGVELYRMGQTNVMGRYPMHFHLLDDCPTCYFKNSAVHRSFYRCISIHGTNRTTVTENVAYDVTGFCYYLEDGVEMENTISFNLAAHIHPIGDLPWGNGQQTNQIYQESPTLRLPADVAASGFYITNVHNTIVGNAASGGWSGFAFPSLPTALGGFRHEEFRPMNVPTLLFDGNTAHSTGWWWYHAGAFYIGGSLYYNDDDVLEYNPGRGPGSGLHRNPCMVNSCLAPYNNCDWGCPSDKLTSTVLSNNKAFMTAGVGLNSWNGPVDVHGFECHDCRLAVQAISKGFYMENLLAVCRTGESLEMQTPRAGRLEATGFNWYDTEQSHIITSSTFRNCGLRSEQYQQYDDSATRGCANEGDSNYGCSIKSTVFGLLSHSDQFNPEIMQATREINFENCGRRFRFTQEDLESVSGLLQNWLDVDGSISGLGEPTLIGSGLPGARDWWGVEDSVVNDEQGPLKFIRKNDGPQREFAHVRLSWDQDLHNEVGTTICTNGSGRPCNPEGFVRHLGRKFSPFSGGASLGLPFTANPDIAGLSGGYGWLLEFNTAAPRSLTFEKAEIDPSSVLLVSIPYPKGTTFEVTARSSKWCNSVPAYSCQDIFTQVASVDLVRHGAGNVYHVDPDGVLTVRLTAISNKYVGTPDWLIPDWGTTGRWSDPSYALRRFERDGILLPQYNDGVLHIQARCPSDQDSSPKDGYCSEPFKTDYDPDVCPTGYEQVAYDKCCKVSDPTTCAYPGEIVEEEEEDDGVCPIANRCTKNWDPDGVYWRTHKFLSDGSCISRCKNTQTTIKLTTKRGFMCGDCP